jgi:hypothetical protein
MLQEVIDLLTVSGMRPMTQKLIRAFVARPCYFRVSARHEGPVVFEGREETFSEECI